MKYDITILTDHRYVGAALTNPDYVNKEYVRNVLQEDRLVQEALQRRGWTVHRAAWDDPQMDWSETRFALFRTTWDYFDRFQEFQDWRQALQAKTQTINAEALVDWNIDKHYLKDLEQWGIRIPATVFLEQGDSRSLQQVVQESGWQEVVLKPCVSGAGRHTYRFFSHQVSQYADRYQELIQRESMMLQEFQHQVPEKGELAFVLFGGAFSHSVLKRAKPGDYRVQDDFGGTVHPYQATDREIQWVQDVVARIQPCPTYARVDVIWDNDGQWAVGELELIEPELWFRLHPGAADRLAEAIHKRISLE